MWLRALLIALIFPLISFSQTVTIPEKIEVQPGRLASIPVRWDGDDLRWITSPELDVFREYDPDPKVVRLRVVAYEEGEFRLVAITCKGGKLSEFAHCIIVVGKPGPGPNPPPPPPPPPNDPLLQTLQAAYMADTGAAVDKQKWRLLLRGVYKAAADSNLDAIKTAGDLYLVLRNSSKAVLDDNALFNLRTAISVALKEVVPSAPSAELTAEHKQKAKNLFVRLSNILEAIK